GRPMHSGGRTCGIPSAVAYSDQRPFSRQGPGAGIERRGWVCGELSNEHGGRYDRFNSLTLVALAWPIQNQRGQCPIDEEPPLAETRSFATLARPFRPQLL